MRSPEAAVDWKASAAAPVEERCRRQEAAMDASRSEFTGFTSEAIQYLADLVLATLR
jgi:hypothetical protein